MSGKLYVSIKFALLLFITFIVQYIFPSESILFYVPLSETVEVIACIDF